MSLLEFKNVGKQFDGKWILKDLSISFPNNGLVSIRGRSGSGKSTFLNLTLGLIKPCKGSIFFKNRDISKFKSSELSQFRSSSISIVFQNYNLIDELTAFENVWLASSIAHKYCRKTKKKIFELFERFNLLPLKDKKVCYLSGGEKQRVAIARALINEPRIILADEPTGALDSTNSKNIMEILKSISRERLVILVSHNNELIEEFSDSILELNNGKLIGSIGQKTINFEKIKLKKKPSFWMPKILYGHCKKDHFINAIFKTSFTICLISLLISFGFYNGSSESIKSVKQKSLEYYTAYVSEKTYVEIEGSPLRLVKQQRPAKESIKDSFSNISFLTIHEDLSYYFPSANSFSLNSEPQEACEFSPIYDVTLSEYGSNLLKKGYIGLSNNEHTIIVNEQFENKYNCSVGDLVELETHYYIENTLFNLKWNFYISGIVKEFSFLNNPRIYYSYQGVSQVFSEINNGEITLLETLEDALPNSDESCYRYLIFLHKEKYANLFYERIKEINDSNDFINVDSNCFEIAEAFENLTDSFSLCLTVFSLISAICSCFIVGIISYSNFIKRKKEAAILLTLGSTVSQLEDLYSFEALFNGLISSLISLPIAFVVEKIINLIADRTFMLSNLVNISLKSYINIPLLIPLVVVVLSMFLCFISSSVPLHIMKTLPLQEELRDE